MFIFSLDLNFLKPCVTFFFAIASSYKGKDNYISVIYDIAENVMNVAWGVAAEMAGFGSHEDIFIEGGHHCILFCR